MRSKALEAHFLGKYLAQETRKFQPANILNTSPIERQLTAQPLPYQAEIELHCKACGLRAPAYEHHFHPERKWRFDVAWIPHRIALEIEGGVWSNGRHTRPGGFIKDIEKYNAALALGWRPFRCLPGQLAEAVQLIAKVMERAA